MASLKKLSAILFLGLFIVSSHAEWIAVFMNRIQMRQEIVSVMSKDIEEGQLKSFTFSKAEFSLLSYTPEEKEIIIAGKNYDIADVQEHDGTITVRCLADEKEMQIKKLAKKNQQDQNDQIQKSFSKIFTLQNSSSSVPVIFIENRSRLFSYNVDFPTNVYIDIIVPPPSIV
ncbi:MAG: hypothetical protein ABIY51_01670 [Ferruginibacter sp.]